MSELIIPYIADPENPAPKILQELWAGYGVRLMPYSDETLSEMPVVCLLFAPYRSNNLYLSVEAIWKKYFALQSPDILFVVIGTIPGHAQNYFDILSLPENPHALYRHALPAKSKWVPVASGGVDVGEKLKRFIDGHSASIDPDQSVREAFGRVRKGLQLYSEELALGVPPEDIRDKIFKDGISKHFNAFMARWERYQPYFDALPFSEIFSEMGNLASEMDVLFKKPPADDTFMVWITNTLTLANALYQKLVTVESYVRE